MATEGNGGLGSSQEGREGQMMGPPVQSVDASLMEDSTQNPFPWLKPKIHGLVHEAFEHLVKSGPESVAAFLKEDTKWLDSNIRTLVREAFEHLVKSGPESVAAFLEDSTQNTITTWLDSNIRTLVREAFEHLVKSGPVRFGGSVQSNRMVTEGNGGLGLSEEVRGGQLMDAALERVAEFIMDDSIQNPCSLLESYIRKLAREECERFAKPSPALVGGSSVNRREQIQELDRIILQLHFETGMPDHFFVGKKVKGRDGAIFVKLIDATTGHVVASGPLSSLTLDVVVLAGDFDNKYDDDWTWEHFNSKVELSRPGKRPLLEGDLQVLLKRGVGSLAEFKFTDISTCRPSGKFRLGVKVEPGFFEGIRVREAKTDAFEVKHFKKESEEKHVPRKLDDDVCKLMGIGKNGTFHENLKGAGIFKVKDFLWKRCLDSEGLRKIVGKTLSDKNWNTLGDHAKESVPSGKYHVYYADDTKNSGVVFKNMSELCGLIEDEKYYSAETLSDSQKLLMDTLKRKSYDNWEHIVEYDVRMLDMNQSAAPSEQVFVIPGLAAGDDFFDQTGAGGCHGFLGSKDVRMECGSSSSVFSENYESGSRTYFSSIGDMVSVPRGKSHVYYAKESASKKVAGDKGKAIEEFVGPLQLEMKPSKRARSSQTGVVTGAPESFPSGIDLASSSCVGPPVNLVLDIGAPVPCLPPPVPSREACENSMPDFEDPSFGSMLDNDSIDLESLFQEADGNTAGYGDSFEQGKQLRGSNSPRNEERMIYGGGNVNMGAGKAYGGGGGRGPRGMDFLPFAFGGLSIN